MRREREMRRERRVERACHARARPRAPPAGRLSCGGSCLQAADASSMAPACNHAMPMSTEARRGADGECSSSGADRSPPSRYVWTHTSCRLRRESRARGVASFGGGRPAHTGRLQLRDTDEKQCCVGRLRAQPHKSFALSHLNEEKIVKTAARAENLAESRRE